MAGLEFRGSLENSVPVVAPDVPMDPAYYLVAKPNDPVVVNGSGNVIRATATDAKLYGVLASREIQRSTESPKIGKVRTSRNATYEVAIAAGTPVPNTAYELTASGQLDATKTVNASVRFVRFVRNLQPDGSYQQTALVTLV